MDPKKGTVEKLVADYPSHSFVIDDVEARELFENVDAPDETLEEMARNLPGLKYTLDPKGKILLFFLSA